MSDFYLRKKGLERLTFKELHFSPLMSLYFSSGKFSKLWL